jgi:LDH2 family malate/lactate/ureidoglycolate dehydrogenase
MQADPTKPSGSGTNTVPVTALKAFIHSLFAATGLSPAASQRMADGLVEADQQGLGSHGVSQAVVYLERLRLGSVTTAERAKLVVDGDVIAVLDAAHMLGHLAAEQAMDLAISRAKARGVGVVAMRQGFHFGVSGRYASQAARQGCVGIVMCNAKPVMPAPGGAVPLVGTNPLAIAIPTAKEPLFMLDMATSEGGLGKIRAAARSGDAIPSTWAVTATGMPTTDPAEALKGMLLPSGGPKGFALSFTIDLLCGLLSGGAWGDAVKGLYDDRSVPNDSSSLFIALDASHFRPLDEFTREAELARDRVLDSAALPGVKPRTPGQALWAKWRGQQDQVAVDPVVLASLSRLAADLGVAPFSDAR